MVSDKKFIFVTGGVLSSLGKGLSAAALGTLLEAETYVSSMSKWIPISMWIQVR